MDWIVVVLVAAAVVGGAFVLGLMTDDRRWAWLAALLPVGLLVRSAVLDATEDKTTCHDACASTWGLFLTVVSLVPAIVLAAAVLVGVAVNRRGSSRAARRGQPASS